MKRIRTISFRVGLAVSLAILTLGGCGNTEKQASSGSRTDTQQENDAAMEETTEKKEADDKSAEDISSDFTACARFGSIPLGASFLLAERPGYSPVNSTVHGCHYVASRALVYIETLLEHDDVTLEEIPYALQDEYKNRKYMGTGSTSWMLYHDDEQAPEYAITKTENVKIGDYDACYYETGFCGNNKDSQFKEMGYSFFFQGKPFIMHTSIDEDQEYIEEEILNELKWTIQSLEEYSGESFLEMDPTSNFRHFSGDGITNESRLKDEGYEGEKTVLCLNVKGNQWATDIFRYMNSEYFTGCTADNILEKVLESEEVRDLGTSAMGFFEDDQPVESLHLQKEPVTINGFEMMKYTGLNWTTEKYKTPFVIYTMMFEDLPYIFEFVGNTYSKVEGEDRYRTDEQEEVMLTMLDYLAFETMNTLREVEDGVDPMEYYY